MAEFKKYNSIENSYQSKFVNRALCELNGYNDFVVQEKIHGANFSLHVSENEIKCAKRTDFIREDESFFDYKTVLNKVDALAYEIRNIIGDDVVLFGELFGKGVQKEVRYGEEKNFYLFDIYVPEHNTWLSVWEIEEMRLMVRNTGIIFADILMRGTLEECFSFDIVRDSILGVHLGVVGENICEGVVIRPNHTFFTGDKRIIFKKKNDSFSEKKAPNTLPKDFSIFSGYKAYLTKNRLDGMISKLGPITDRRQLGEYGLFLAKDIIEDAEKDGIEKVEGVEKYMTGQSVKFILSELF